MIQSLSAKQEINVISVDDFYSELLTVVDFRDDLHRLYRFRLKEGQASIVCIDARNKVIVEAPMEGFTNSCNWGDVTLWAMRNLVRLNTPNTILAQLANNYYEKQKKRSAD